MPQLLAIAAVYYIKVRVFVYKQDNTGESSRDAGGGGHVAGPEEMAIAFTPGVNPAIILQKIENAGQRYWLTRSIVGMPEFAAIVGVERDELEILWRRRA